ncbi:hypothetical protein BEN47_03335 [Hymenobacter lapidarius]|uniref:Uncharacterized protein n=1 Tax=Hymenobacter lapidarius TaxID=1908237 RepID=A0A1G1SXI8_9BACT|nr:hypothetical protein [Hymenobacter lapidarius]OGX83340.1 hypothetical protein BEN47_03335 [Hymenobacter lapidarius]
MIAHILSSQTVRTFCWGLRCAMLGIVVSGCEKESGPTKVSGQVVEFYTGKPVPYGKVQLLASNPNGRINIVNGGGLNAKGDPHLADAQGRFTFTFEAQRNINYGLRGRLDPYYFGNTEVSIDGGRANNDLRVPVFAFAWVRYVIVNELPKPPNSVHSLYITGHGSGLGINIYQPRDTVIIERVIGGTNTRTTWFVRDRQGKSTQYDKNTLVPPLDTLDVRITF